MAFGIGRIVKAVEDLSVRVTGISTELSTAVTQSGTDLGTDLNDIRRISEANSREIAAVRTEIAELCALVENRRTEPAGTRSGARPAAETATGFEPCPLDESLHPDDQPHHDLLAHAAGVANAELVCHADTWAFITQHASRGEHFRMPVDITGDAREGTVEVRFSGRTLIAVADALWEVTQTPGVPPGTHHLAAQTYNRLHGALADTGPGGTGGVVRVVIDDRAPARPDADGHADGHRDRHGDGDGDGDGTKSADDGALPLGCPTG